MKAKIICILVMTLLITTALPTVGKITNSNGSIETGQETTPFDPNLLKPTQSLRGYNIALINDDGYAPDVKTQLELWGATVDIINIPDITVALLSGYHVVWIPAESAKLIDDGGKDDEIRDYVFAGGGLIFTQPNVVGVYIPKCLPYTWEITDHWYGYPCAATIVDPTHELTQGLTIDDMPDSYDESGNIASEYTILALSDDGEPGFACAEYGTGKIIVTMDAALIGSMDVCGDSPSLSEDMVMRMLDWAKKAKSVEVTREITINSLILNFLQCHPNLFSLLQKLLQFGL